MDWKLGGLTLLLVWAGTVQAHGGRTNAEGCHNERATGDYHCHPDTPPTPREPYYATCADARAAGVAPLYRGQPGYRLALDGDRDGVACE